MEKLSVFSFKQNEKQKFEKLAVSADLKISHYNFIQTVVLHGSRREALEAGYVPKNKPT